MGTGIIVKDSINLLQGKLANYPSVTYQVKKNELAVRPSSETGFAVTFSDCDNQFVVTYGGCWHEHFNDLEEAIKCFIFGLSSKCRLKVESKGTFEFRWTLQSRIDDAWSDANVIGLFFYPFWRKTQVKFLQNEFL